MKNCPVCAEESRDEALHCRRCGGDLAALGLVPIAGGDGGDPHGTGQPGQEETGPETVIADEDRAAAGTPPGTSSGPATVIDPSATGVPGTGTPGTGAPAASGEVAAAGPGAAAAGVGAAARYTHTGHRFVLGYGDDFFGIWDRQAPGQPVRRYPRTDAGWQSAWTEFAAWEPHNQAVPQAGAAGAGVAAGAAAAQPAGAWQQPQQQAWQQPQPQAQPAWQQPQQQAQPAWQQPQAQPAWQQPVQPAWGAPAYQGQKTNGMAIASLVLGIVWLYGVGSILALIFGYIAKRDIDRSNGAQTGRGMALAGIILGWIGVALLILVIVVAAAGSSNNGF